jgi:endonuclease/exonuclease/phosphatase family metal-dependent hydrolase
MNLTLVTWNIHSGIGVDGRFDLARIASVLEEVDADLIALQEVGDYRRLTPREDHAEHLAELLGRHLAYGPNICRGDRRYGNAVLSRFPISHHQNDDLSWGRREPRGALRCDVALPEAAPLHLVCVHFGLGPRERLVQEGRLLETALLRDAQREAPLLVCGDWNYLRRGPASGLEAAGLRDVAVQLGCALPTCPSPMPVFRFDRVLTDGRLKPMSMAVHRSRLAARASDHLPLVLRFQTEAAPRCAA